MFVVVLVIVVERTGRQMIVRITTP